MESVLSSKSPVTQRKSYNADQILARAPINSSRLRGDGLRTSPESSITRRRPLETSDDDEVMSEDEADVGASDIYRIKLTDKKPPIGRHPRAGNADQAPKVTACASNNLQGLGKCADIFSSRGKCVLLVMFVIVVALLKMGLSNMLSPTLLTNEDVMRRFESSFERFSGEFPSQTLETLKVVRVAVKSLLRNPDPLRPAIVVLLSTEKDDRVSACFARKLAKIVDDSYESPRGVTILDGDQLGRLESGKCKHALDNNITNSLANDDRHVVVVEHLNRLSADCVLAFHAFCDDTNAPYKDVVYIFSLDVDSSGSVTATQPWSKSMSMDKLASLESRIGANTVMLVPEQNNCVNDQQ